MLKALDDYTVKRTYDYTVTDEAGNIHNSWILTDQTELDYFINLVAEDRVVVAMDNKTVENDYSNNSMDDFIFKPISKNDLSEKLEKFIIKMEQ